MASNHMLTLTDQEVHEAITEWCNTHRFKEPILVVRLTLHETIQRNSQWERDNIVDFVYVRNELEGKYE